ncbi:hypothetical protein [Phenylobacterium sp.]|uniref:O-linked N-acetylglucosamine transferase, SPINDLY family protein n=1 Tax=Phenylobacterium sp. TaxID=1871053 RepID=UPI002DE6089C|nr:hypothetical protein [Phenylobacterium sp.]
MARESIPDTAEAALARARELYHAGRFADGARFTEQAVAAHAEAPDLWNIHGVMLRQLGRGHEALGALDRALSLKPDHPGARVNRAGVVLDLARAINEGEGPHAALAILDEGLGVDPQNLGLAEAKALMLRAAGPRARAEAFLQDFVARRPDVAWAQLYLGDILAERDPALGEAHLRRAAELDPGSAATLVPLIQNLARATGPDEGRKLDEAHRLCAAVLAGGALTPNQTKVVRDVFSRVCDFAAIERLGDFSTLGRAWADAGLHTALLRQLSRVGSHADRLELLEQHRICGRVLSAEAERRPIRKAPPRPPAQTIRLGFLSSDLRRHPVGYFVEPLFEHLDPERIRLFCYGFDNRGPDPLQAVFASRATAFRQMPEASAHEAAQAIADDDLDVLIELGGSTALNKLEVMAYGAAPRQASWLGYPHSAGLAAIDGLICDPFNVPPDRSLLAETPLILPKTWIALGPSTFSDAHAIEARLPEERHGGLTFGTANNPYKYTPQALATWASIVASTPGSRFMFLRPEGASAGFRAHILAAFAAEGVGAERVVFQAVRGGHMPLYNEIDITLDTFPLTGGTTTVEALWMGAPVISLRGEAFYERLSWSILANLDLPDLVAEDLAGYRAAALALAADRDRRADLRATLRQAIRSSPLGDTQGFARDFYALIENTVR